MRMPKLKMKTFYIYEHVFLDVRPVAFDYLEEGMEWDYVDTIEGMTEHHALADYFKKTGR